MTINAVTIHRGGAEYVLRAVENIIVIRELRDGDCKAVHYHVDMRRPIFSQLVEIGLIIFRKNSDGGMSVANISDALMTSQITELLQLISRLNGNPV